MSMRYADAVEATLKLTVWPTLTLIDVAKPCSVGSPAPVTCQSLGATPGSVFSHAITLSTGGPHAPADTAGRVATNDRPRSVVAMTTVQRRDGRRRPNRKVPTPVMCAPLLPLPHVERPGTAPDTRRRP